MAQIAARNDESILKIKEFLGLNENPDGDTTLKNGEMAELRNFRITQDKHLQIRPGTAKKLSLRDTWDSQGGAAYYGVTTPRLCGVWYGTVGGAEKLVAAFGGGLFDVDPAGGIATAIGKCAQADASFFGFSEKVYLLNGADYLCWDGGSGGFGEVTGYIPLVQIATTPAGAGTPLEGVNRLNGKRRVQFSPDGSAAVFQLPEKEIAEVLGVALNGTAQSGYSVNASAGTVTLASAPAAGTNTLEITYRKGDGARGDVEGMKFAELFNGATDTRVFLYGDGTNRAVYSGIPYSTGQPSAEYFPDLFEVAVGESNTPLTALVRHHSRLMAFKPNSAWMIQYGSVTLNDGSLTAAFYCQPVNRQFGNESPGQVKLLENNPLTLDAGSVYQWRTGSSGYIGKGENNAKRISDRVAETVGGFDFSQVLTVNVKGDHEFWLLPGGGRALILNYSNDTWYVYENLPFRTILEVNSGKYGFAVNGDVLRFSRDYRNDCGANISCCAVTGAMDFGRDWLLKYSPMIFVAMQPESGARIYVTVETNRRSDYPKKLVAYNLATFLHVDFKHFSFGTNRKPQVKRVKMKVKKATFYRLIFKSDSASATATVIETDIKLRYAGNVK